MILTYRKECPIPEGRDISIIPHQVLSDQIKQILTEKNIRQRLYTCLYHLEYFFIYFDNGDRLDCEL
jgi:hypothetical protein